MGAPVGNKNGAKGKEWTDALRHALQTYEGSAIKRGMALRAIAEKVVEKAVDGDRECWQEIGNRLDGKPVQSIEGHVEQSGTVTHEHVELPRVAERATELLSQRVERASQGTLPH